MGGARVLIVEDERLVLEQLGKLVARYAQPELAATAAEARTALARSLAWAGFIIDPGLPDGNGLDVLSEARASYPRVPALVLCGASEPEVVNRAFDLGAHYVVKPQWPERVMHFLVECVRPSQADEVIEGMVVKFHLSEAMGDILRRAVRGETREQIAAGRGCTPATVQRQVSALLERVGADFLHDVVDGILRELIGG